MTLGLCSQRELDAVVAKSAKKVDPEAAGAAENVFGGDRQALIEELQAEREKAAKAAVEAAQEAEAQAWLEARRAQEANPGE